MIAIADNRNALMVDCLRAYPSIEDFGEDLASDGSAYIAAALVDLETGAEKAGPRGEDLTDALDTLQALARLNSEYHGSLCQALEYAFKQVFHAGRAYEAARSHDSIS